MAPKILLVNPPIYDFAAYDFWLKPYGMLSVAGFLRGEAEFEMFDYLDRQHPFMAERKDLASDRWGRGRFHFEKIESPAVLRNIPRYFRRFGLPRETFVKFLTERQGFDFVLVQTMMTYWYQGVSEVIEDIRRVLPKAKIILGGNYVTLCKSHAEKLGADFLVVGNELEPLWRYLGMKPDLNEPTLWEAYDKLSTGVLKLSEGCPFSCTYCSVPSVYRQFAVRPMERSLAEFRLLVERGVKNIAFYDDALLFEAERVLAPFLREVIKADKRVNLHSPNALNARFLTEKLAGLMVEAGFKTFYLGYESGSVEWQKKTGSKVTSAELEEAVKALVGAGAEPANITAYQILGHPHGDIQEMEESMRFVSGLGIRGMLADFSPIPGTPDGEYCRKWVDMDEPLFHSKTAFPIIVLGFDETNRLKDLQRKLNRFILRDLC
jgi:radical SAM superfamily enzyme YgiQ (UPF0313 family)